MILLDLSGTMYSNIMVELLKPDNRGKPVQEDLILHMIYNSIREKAMSFKNEYGKLVICVDSKSYWRKAIFPHYKFKRKANREKDGMDWDAIFKCIDNATSYIQTFFPYKFIRVENAEADDVIGVLAPKIAATGETVLIVSRDSDLTQLLKYPNVKQYSPVDKKFLALNDVDAFLKNKIICGDTSDSIPNILSDDDAIASDSKRQKPMTKPRLEEYMTKAVSEYPDEIRKNYERNKKLIDLTEIPKYIQENILYEFEKPISGSKMFLLQHLADKKMRVLMRDITDF